MLFDGTTSEKNYAKAYWLASPGIGEDGTSVNFGPGRVGDGVVGPGRIISMFASDGYRSSFGIAVRPVVSLQFNITQTEVPITTKSEVDWTTRPLYP